MFHDLSRRRRTCTFLLHGSEKLAANFRQSVLDALVVFPLVNYRDIGFNRPRWGEYAPQVAYWLYVLPELAAWRTDRIAGPVGEFAGTLSGLFFNMNEWSAVQP